MSAPQSPFIVAAYIPCQMCNYPCVIVERFDHNPSEDEIDRHASVRLAITADRCRFGLAETPSNEPWLSGPSE